LSLADELKAAAKRGDATRVVELVEGATEKERRAAAPQMERFGMPRDQPAWRLAWLGTATAREAVTWWFMFDDADIRSEQLLRVVRARGKPFLSTLVRAFERDALMLWPIVRAAVRAGVIERPESSAYARALATASGARARFWAEDSVYRALLADDTLLEEDVWLLFEADASSELAGAVFYEQTGSHTLGKPVGNRWTYALTRLAREGRIDRQRLLDESLAALQRDFRASSVGWHAKLHEALEPTREEREARLGTYLALLGSPVPSVAKEGVAALKALGDAVPATELARAAPPALTLPQKALALDVLRLLGQACKREPDARPALLAAAAEALAHERADVQERALALLEAHAAAVDRARLLRYADAVSPSLRARVEALTGISTAPPAAAGVAIPVPARPRATPATAARTRARLEPVASVDDLIELAAALLEGQGTGDDGERFLDGVSRLGARRDAGFGRRVAALTKRAAEARGWADACGHDGASVAAHVVLAWTARKAPPKRTPQTLLGFVGLRASEVAKRVRSGGQRPLLAFPTHAGGWIEPAALEERVRGFGRLINRPDTNDLAQAQLRSGAFDPIRLRPELASRTFRWGEAVRSVDVGVAALPAELRAFRDRLVSGPERSAWGVPFDGMTTVDPLGVHWLLTVMPSDPEPAYAHALRRAVDSRDGDSAYGHPEIVLEHALDPDVPITQLGWQAAAAGLLGKPQEVKRAAVDVVVQTVGDGRFDAELLAAGLAWLVANDLGKPNRLEQPLRDAGRVSPLHAAQVARTVVGLAAALPSTPRGLVGSLELAAELSAATGQRVDGGAERAALERIAGEVSATSKLGRSARALLRS
jgi:hypothetical protein